MKIVQIFTLLFKISKKFSFSRFCNLFRYLKNEGVRGTKRRLLECIYSGSGQKLAVSQVKTFASIQECGMLEFKAQEHPKVSVIIPVYNEFSYTYQCLKSIAGAGDQTAYELILADDGSDDLTMQIGQAVSGLRIIKSTGRLGFLKNCNHAAAYAQGDYIFFLNNDTQVQPGWLDSQIRLMEEHADIGMTGGKLVYPDGRLQEAGGIIWQDGSAWNYGHGQDGSAPEYNYVKDVDYISGAAIMVRADLWRKIGGFDERYAPAYCEDSDLAFAVRKAGYRVVYQPQSVIVHYEGISNGTDIHAGLKKYQLDNTKKLYQKWKAEIRRLCRSGENVFQSRERSRGKSIILFVDHYVPMADRDAGSRTVFQYLRMLCGKGFVIKFIGDNFYQSEPYTSVLQQMGIEVLYGPYYQKHIFEWLDSSQTYIDVVFLNRPHISIKYMDYFYEKTDLKIIYYGHDLHYLRKQREFELTGDQKIREEVEKWKEQEFYLMRHADISYYPSQVEAEVIRQADQTISVKAVTAYAFDIFREKIFDDSARREGILFVGGFAHGPNCDAVMWFVREVYPLIRAERQIPFYIAGSYPTAEIEKLDGRNGVLLKAFASDEELEQLYTKCRLAVVPLRYGAGVKGKTVEALYYGIPIVTTSAGAEGIPDICQAACVADGAEHFAAAVIQLYDDMDRLHRMSAESQKVIRRHFSMDAAWNQMKEDFESYACVRRAQKVFEGKYVQKAERSI